MSNIIGEDLWKEAHREILMPEMLQVLESDEFKAMDFEERTRALSRKILDFRLLGLEPEDNAELKRLHEGVGNGYDFYFCITAPGEDEEALFSISIETYNVYNLNLASERGIFFTVQTNDGFTYKCGYLC